MYSAYTQQLILYTWDELILNRSSICRPLHEKLSKSNSEDTFAEYVLCSISYTPKFMSIGYVYLAYLSPTEMLLTWLIINAKILCMITNTYY